MLNPPYPYSKHGCDPSKGMFFLATTKIGISVPSLLGMNTWIMKKTHHIVNEILHVIKKLKVHRKNEIKLVTLKCQYNKL